VRRITVLRFLSAETRNDVTAIRKDLYQYFETMLEPQSGGVAKVVGIRLA